MGVTLNGKLLTLVGRNIRIGQVAPNFSIINDKFEEVKLDSFKGKIKVITTFVSIDTPVCDLQVKTFNKKATELSDNIVVMGISKDLPFAQKRFCAINEIKNALIFSDFKSSSFGINYGLLIKENNLLARATIILDANDVVRFFEIVNEITTEPNYDGILNNLNKVINSRPVTVDASIQTTCVPCETGALPLEKKAIAMLFSQITGWELVENKKLVKDFKFKDFVEAKYFLDLLAIIAQEQGHHPNFSLIYNKLKVTLTTHASGGLSPNDFVMAKIIDEVA